MAKRKKVKKKAKRLITFGFVSIFLIVSILITFISVFVELIDKYHEKNELEEQLVYLEEKEKELENTALKLEDPEYLSRYAREKYFYSKEGELIIRIPED